MLKRAFTLTLAALLCTGCGITSLLSDGAQPDAGVANDDKVDGSGTQEDGSESAASTGIGEGGDLPPCGDGGDCNPEDLGGESCGSLGAGFGSLSCDPATCTFDLSMCVSGDTANQGGTSGGSLPGGTGGSGTPMFGGGGGGTAEGCTGSCQCNNASCSDIGCAGGSCTAECAGGDCTLECDRAADCEFTCSGGGCDLACDEAASCALDCAGGDCNLDCEEPGTLCSMDCGGGNCTLNCADGGSATCTGDCTLNGC